MPVISVRVSPVEQATIQADARRDGLTVSDYVRRAIEIVKFNEYGNALDRLTDVELRLVRLEDLAERHA